MIDLATSKQLLWINHHLDAGDSMSVKERNYLFDFPAVVDSAFSDYLKTYSFHQKRKQQPIDFLINDRATINQALSFFREATKKMHEQRLGLQQKEKELSRQLDQMKRELMK